MFLFSKKSKQEYPIYRAIGHINTLGNPCYIIEVKYEKILPWERLLFGKDLEKVKLYYDKESVLNDLKILNYKAFTNDKGELVEKNNHSVIIEKDDQEEKPNNKIKKKIPKYIKVVK